MWLHEWRRCNKPNFNFSFTLIVNCLWTAGSTGEKASLQPDYLFIKDAHLPPSTQITSNIGLWRFMTMPGKKKPKSPMIVE